MGDTESRSLVGAAGTSRRLGMSTALVPGRKAARGELERTRTRAERRARGLGWFSVSLGLAQLLAPGALGRMIGLGRVARRHRAAMRAVGLRELAAGVGILRHSRPSGWLWARLAGDVMDLAMLGSAMRSRRARRARLGGSLAAVAGVAALDLVTGRQLGRRLGRDGSSHGIVRVTRVVTVNRSPEEVYRFWRQLDNLPRFMANVDEVRVLDGRRSHWKVRGLGGKSFAWDAEIVDDRPNESLAWCTLAGADVASAGLVRFLRAPGGRGTEVLLEMQYDPPGGALGAAMAKVFGREPGQQVEADMRRFKQVMETGEVVVSDASLFTRPHPARPPKQPKAQGGTP
jgi:uncharacterized membrane protein